LTQPHSAPPSEAPSGHTEPGRIDSQALHLQALDAQVRLLPYALAFFALCLPVFLAVAAFAANRAWLGLSMGLYALNWTLFYAASDWRRRTPEAAVDPALRSRIQMTAGALWAIAIAQTAWFSLGAGPVSEILLILCAGAAAGVIFFTSPCLEALLVVGPAAAAGPVAALLSRPDTHHTGLIALSGEALALAFALILNRHLREHFALALEREALMAERGAALDRASALARSKSDLIATLSHEIRNGLTGVTHVLAGAVGAGPRGGPSREQLRAGLEAVRDLAGVLDATLDSERAEAGALQVASAPLDLAGLARDLVQAHRPGAAAKGLELDLRIDDTLAEATGAAIGDAARVRQILDQLIGNAVKYTLRGRVELTLSRAGAERARLDVVDTGPGLSGAELEQAFTPFSRVGRTGAGVPGAGLGLSLSRRLAQLMGGSLGVESAPGVGSRFWLDLPWDSSVAAAPPPPCVSEAPGALRVLTVDDNALSAAMLRAALESLGHRVLHAQDGERALELLHLGELDLVLIDARLQTPSAPETARRLRALPAGARLPLIAVIGGDAAEAEALQTAGADAVLRKPATVAGVARVIADVRAATAPARAA
jgi:signal transduction histidine kinase/ActR/RegA family two-component response regulator